MHANVVYTGEQRACNWTEYCLGHAVQHNQIWQGRALACECVKGKPYKRKIGSQIKVSKNASTVDNVR